MSTMAQERVMAEEADRAAMVVAEREAAADKALKILDAARAAEPGPAVPKVIREDAKPAEEPLQKADGTPTARGWRAIGKALQTEMPSKTFKGRGGKSFSYITARQVAARLDIVVGPGNWSTEVRVVRAEHPVAVLVGLAIFGVWKWDAGYSNNPEADDPTTDKAYEDEPLKAAVSDGFKRAAVQWSIGRWLYGD
jgi:hypothetical protein